MKKNAYTLLLINFITIVVLVSNTTFIQAVTPTWNVGDILKWGYLTNQQTIVVNLEKTDEELRMTDEKKVVNEIEYNITSIDSLTKEFDAYFRDYDSISFINNRHYAADIFVNAELDIDDFLDVDYDWDYEHNRTVCTNFDIDLTYWYLIEPDWAQINEGYKTMLNGSELIDTVNDPYSSTIYNFTLANILSAIPIKIMGKNTLNKALPQFTSKYEWDFDFDLSNYIYDDRWNGTMTIYYPYELYKVYLHMSYTEGGVLQDYLIGFQSRITIDDIQTQRLSETKIALGGAKAVLANFAIFSAIGALLTTTIVIMLIAKRKK